MFGKRKKETRTEKRQKSREAEIASLEEERESISRELVHLARRYAKLTGDKSVLRGLQKVGSGPNDPSFWR